MIFSLNLKNFRNVGRLEKWTKDERNKTDYRYPWSIMFFTYLQTFTKLATDNFTKETISILLLNTDIYGNLIWFGQKEKGWKLL